MTTYAESQAERDVVVKRGAAVIDQIVDAAADIIAVFERYDFLRDVVGGFNLGDIEPIARLAHRLGRGNLGQDIMLEWAEADGDNKFWLEEPDDVDAAPYLAALSMWGITPRATASDDGLFEITSTPDFLD